MSLDGRHLLLGEARWTESRVTREVYAEASADLLRRGVPPLRDADRCKVVHAVFLPELPPGLKTGKGQAPLVVTAADVLAVLH
jgi:hypothetical protein